MPITIKPSKSVEINFDEAENGDMVVATLENGQKLFLKYVTDDDGSRGHLTFDERWLPRDLVETCNALVPQLLRKGNYRKLFDAREDASEDLMTMLSRELRVGLWIQTMNPLHNRSGDIDVGLVPYTFLHEPGGGSWNCRWDAQAPIRSIAVTTEYDAEVYKATQSKVT